MSLIGWDGLGITSFLLIVYYKNRKRLGSGMITALSNRLGDCLFLCCLGFLLHQGFLWLRILICLCITKSAQFPFSSWLPAAMAAPTPVRALVHSSTLVTAGVYLLIRYCNIDTRSIMFIGRCTLLIAGFRACAESDIKKVVALSTLSQLGVMIIALGAHIKSYCFFHLMTHACFKSLLFMCVGVCIHTRYGTQEFRRYRILRSKILVAMSFTVSIVSLMRFVFTSGFYRKSMILESLLSDSPSWTSSFFLIGVGLTCCYSIKLLAMGVLSKFLSTRASLCGGYAWQVKFPLFIMSRMRIIFGSMVSSYCGPLTLFLCSEVKTHHINWDLWFAPWLIVIGIWLGTRSPLASPFLSGLLWTTPNTQYLSSLSVSIDVVQKNIDKGIMEIGIRSLSPLSLTLITHYTPAYIVGLRVLFLFLL